MIDFSGKVALVTGAGKGIGRSIALALAERGASVVVNNRTRNGADPASDLVAEIEQSGGTAVAEHSSVEVPGAADALVAAALDNFGRLDLVIANAAVVDRATFAKADPDRFRDVIEIDFMAPVALARAALTEVKKRSGRFLFMTSTAGAYGEFGASSYAAAKAALNAFAKSLALEVERDGVKVNLIAPYALTQMTEGFITDDQARALTPESVVPAAMWLVGPDVRVTGVTLVAAANTFRALATGEAAGVAFPIDTDVTDDQFARVAHEALDLDGWIDHRDGISAFRHLMASVERGGDEA